METISKIITVILTSFFIIVESNAQMINDSTFILNNMAVKNLNQNSRTFKSALDYMKINNPIQAESMNELAIKNKIDPNLEIPKFNSNKDAIEFTYLKHEFRFYILANGDVKMVSNNRSITFQQPLDINKIHESLIRFYSDNSTSKIHSNSLINLIIPTANAIMLVDDSLTVLIGVISIIVVPMVIMVVSSLSQYSFEKKIGEADTFCQKNISKTPTLAEEKKIEELHTLLSSKCLIEDLKQQYWKKICPQINSIKSCLGEILQKNSKINESSKAKIIPKTLEQTHSIETSPK